MQADTIARWTGWVTYGPHAMALDVDIPTKRLLEAELTPFFDFADREVLQMPSSFISIVADPASYDTSSIRVTGEQIDVDTSLYKHLASKGTLWHAGSSWTVRIEQTGSCFIFDSQTQSARLFQPSCSGRVLDLARAIKGLTTQAIEAAGGVQLHSSCVLADEQTVLVLGDMWQGKTTLLLELLSKFDVQQVSCDTTCLMPGRHGQYDVRGWPSPFSVSHGTMADHPQLHRFIPEERRTLPYETLWREQKKSVMASKEVVNLFGRSLRASGPHPALTIVSRFKPKEPTGLRVVTDLEALRNYLGMVYLGSRDPIYHNWHRYISCGDDKIDDNIAKLAVSLVSSAQVVELTWAPSAESLMRRLPIIARRHKMSAGMFVGEA